MRERLSMALVLATLYWLGATTWPLPTSAPIAVMAASTWSEPVTVAYQGFFPSLTIDDDGDMHAVWSSNDTGLEISGWGDTLYYARWNESGWTAATDIIAASPGSTADYPTLLTTSNNLLHLFWRSDARVMHSQVLKGEAAQPAAWSSPRAVISFDFGPVTGYFPYTAIADSSDRLHLVYVQSDGSYWELRHMMSEDRGATWSLPSTVAIAEEGLAYTLPRLASSPDSDALYVVWTAVQSDAGWPPIGVFGARSLDGGAVWSSAFTHGDYQQGFANVAYGRDGAVHVVWNGSAEGQGRYYQVSGDHGSTWSSVITLSPRFGLTQGWPAIVGDEAGMVHVFAFGDNERGDDIYHYVVDEGDVGAEELFSPGDAGGYAGNPVAVMRSPGQLHVLWSTLDKTSGRVWHRYFTPDGFTRPLTVADPSAMQSGVEVESATIPETPIPAIAAASEAALEVSLVDAPERLGGGSSPLLLGLGSSMLLMILVVAVRRLTSRR